MLIAPPASAPRLIYSVHTRTNRYGGLHRPTPSSELTTLGLIGRNATALIADLGAFDPSGDAGR